jgi:hypothetical protein
LADASAETQKYFVTGNLIYLATVNLVMPILAGFVLPIVLAKLTHQGTVSIPVQVVPIEPSSDSMPIEPMSSAAKAFYSGTASLLGMFTNRFTLSVANQVSNTGLSVTDVGSGTTASGLSAKDIINIALALISFGALTWDYIQQSLCQHDRQN